MPKSFRIQAQHVRPDLAARHTRQLEKEFNATVSYQRRNSQGLFSRRGQFYTFTVTPRKRMMYRLIVAYPYLINPTGKRRAYESPDKRTKRGLYYGHTKGEVLAEKTRIRRELVKQIKGIPKAWIQDRKEHPLYRKVRVTTAQIRFEARKIGVTEYLDD